MCLASAGIAGWTLEDYPGLGDQVVVVGVKAGGGDLHSDVDDEVGVRGFPFLWSHDVKGCGSYEVLHFAVAGAANVVGRVIFNLEPHMPGGVCLCQCRPRDGAALRVGLAGWQCAADG